MCRVPDLLLGPCRMLTRGNEDVHSLQNVFKEAPKGPPCKASQEIIGNKAAIRRWRSQSLYMGV